MAMAISIPRGRMLRGIRSWLPGRVVALAAAALALAMVQVWMSNQVRAVAWDLSRVQRLQTELTHRLREAQIQLEMERDPIRLRSRAKRHLGMVEPRAGQMIDVMPPGGAGSLGTAP